MTHQTSNRSNCLLLWGLDLGKLCMVQPSLLSHCHPPHIVFPKAQSSRLRTFQMPATKAFYLDTYYMCSFMAKIKKFVFLNPLMAFTLPISCFSVTVNAGTFPGKKCGIPIMNHPKPLQLMPNAIIKGWRFVLIRSGSAKKKRIWLISLPGKKLVILLDAYEHIDRFRWSDCAQCAVSNSFRYLDNREKMIFQ